MIFSYSLFIVALILSAVGGFGATYGAVNGSVLALIVGILGLWYGGFLCALATYGGQDGS